MRPNITYLLANGKPTLDGLVGKDKCMNAWDTWRPRANTNNCIIGLAMAAWLACLPQSARRQSWWLIITPTASRSPGNSIRRPQGSRVWFCRGLEVWGMGDYEYGYDYWQEGNTYASYRTQSEGSWVKSIGMVAITAGAVGLGVWYVTRRRKQASSSLVSADGVSRRQTKQEPAAIVQMTSGEKQAAHRGYYEEDVDAVLNQAIANGMVGMNKLVRTPRQVFLSILPHHP
jgi:hypothetical protein